MAKEKYLLMVFDDEEQITEQSIIEIDRDKLLNSPNCPIIDDVMKWIVNVDWGKYGHKFIWTEITNLTNQELNYKEDFTENY